MMEGQATMVTPMREVTIGPSEGSGVDLCLNVPGVARMGRSVGLAPAPRGVESVGRGRKRVGRSASPAWV